ncbi:MAG: beta-ketoacyl-ACP synthase 3 [Spirochaetaceae bacterium]|jgi:3-oxoacyl-[acyl-carrier-protein] synthase-3|nr:beta-ketoacyl-ACP synthase 3 [Spirochaetaceae bacterium]
MAYEIAATGRALPARRVTNEELSQTVDTNDEWIRSHTGIGSRYLAEPELANSELAARAARQAIAQLAEKTGASEEDVTAGLDMIIVASVTGDYLGGVPPTSCLVQNLLGARQAAAFDIQVCCTGFIYGLEIAAGLLAVNPGYKKVLLICSELLSRITDWTDRSTCVLFGDGAAAAIIEKTTAPSSGEGKRGLLRCILGADGSGGGNLIVRRGGSRFPYKPGEIVDKPPHIEMDGRAVYNFAVKSITETIKALLEQENLSVHDLALIIPHQANARIVQAAQKRLALPENILYLNMSEYANTSAASIPIALDEANRAGKIKRGDIVMFVGFGGGLTYGGALVVW